jgi:putative MATE family efflux protein
MSSAPRNENFRDGKGDLTQGPVGGHLVRLSAPMIWGIFAFVSFQLADMFFVSRLGPAPLAAISFTLPVGMGLFNLFIGLSIAMSSVLSRQIGEGNIDRVRRICTHGVMFALGLGLVSALLGFLFMDPLFRAMGADAETLALVRRFMSIWFFGNMFMAVPLAGNAAMRASGDSLTPALIYNAAALLNIVLDPFLIYGWAGMPRLEIEGAAIATSLSNMFACALCFYVLRRKNLLSRTGLHLAEMKDSLRRLVFIALPAGLTGMIGPVVNGFVFYLLSGSASGNDAVAAYGVVSRVEAFVFVILMGLSTGMGPVLGQNWGASRYERVRETLRKAFKFVALWSLGIAALLAFAGLPVARLFSDHPQIARIVALYFWIVPFSYLFGNIAMGWNSALNALGLPVQALGLVLLRTIVLTIPLCWLGAHLFGYAGVFAALAAVNVLMGIITHTGCMRLLNRREKARREELRETSGEELRAA